MGIDEVRIKYIKSLGYKKVSGKIPGFDLVAGFTYYHQNHNQYSTCIRYDGGDTVHVKTILDLVDSGGIFRSFKLSEMNEYNNFEKLHNRSETIKRILHGKTL